MIYQLKLNNNYESNALEPLSRSFKWEASAKWNISTSQWFIIKLKVKLASSFVHIVANNKKKKNYKVLLDKTARKWFINDINIKTLVIED